MKILRFRFLIQILYGLFDECVHRFVGHRVTQYMIQHLANEKRYRAFIGIGKEGGRNEGQVRSSYGVLIGRHLYDRQRTVLPGCVLASDAEYLIIYAPACTCVRMEQVVFIGLGLER